MAFPRQRGSTKRSGPRAPVLHGRATAPPDCLCRELRRGTQFRALSSPLRAAAKGRASFWEHAAAEARSSFCPSLTTKFEGLDDRDACTAIANVDPTDAILAPFRIFLAKDTIG